MNEEQRHALASVQFNWAVTPDEIWSPLTHHVEGLHAQAAATMDRAVRAARDDHQPMGLALCGERGVGKTHLLGWLRQRTQQEGGAFFLLKLLDGRSFWAGAVHGVVSGLINRGHSQLDTMLKSLAQRTGCTPEATMRLCGTIPVSRQDLDDLVDRLRVLDPRTAMECQDTLRALVLYRSRGQSSEVGYSYLVLDEGIDETDQARWGFRRRGREPQLLLNDLARIFALTGPVVMAIDQIDTVLTQPEDESGREQLADRLADGLIRLREEACRTIIAVACIPESWRLIQQRAVNSAADRFRVLELRTAMPDAAVAGAIVERHLAGQYADIGFNPPYPTWPIRPEAFENVVHYSPRRMLQRVDEHVRWCLTHDELRELADLDSPPPREAPRPPVEAADLAKVDEHFHRLRAEADTVEALDQDREDERMAALLSAALRCYVLEQNERGQDLAIDPPPGGKPALHARLRLTLDERREDEEHWGFRGISHNNARAVLTRLRSARLEAGLMSGSDKRHLVVLRNIPFSRGPVTTETLREFHADGGLTLPISEEDLRTASALERMLKQPPSDFRAWLTARRPASGMELLARIVALRESRGSTSKGSGAPISVGSSASGVAPSPSDSSAMMSAGTVSSGTAANVVPPGLASTNAVPPAVMPTGTPVASMAAAPSEPEPPAAFGPVSTDHSPTETASIDGDAVVLGVGASDNRPFTVPLILLRKHTAVFAGSGSGKTVLLRRLVEEAALHGVSSILIDTNNDLARLGDAWPSPPTGWLTGDTERARRYLDETDVVVWTPRREAGRPLVLNPLPDFSGVLDDPDEFSSSVEAAVSGLLSKAGVTGNKATTKIAVLTEAMTHFARKGGSLLSEFVALLGDLPDDVSTMLNAGKMAGEMAEQLKAAMITDPLFGGAGEHLDPAVLLTPPPGKRARISVINCMGLPNDEQRQTFVNQLQLALFAWIKRNPARDRPLGGLLVLDEAQTFIPSRGTTASSQSTLRMATQARKYGLGMVYATQAPKALHNLVTGNAATQFFGLLNAPVQIEAAKELARAKGGQVDDIAKLSAGRFYGATEGSRFAKLRIPMCLSHHPASALTEEEVLARARRSNDA